MLTPLPLTRKDIGIGEGAFDSVNWALTTHAQIVDHGKYNFAILYGNADCPNRIEFYKRANPTIRSKPSYVWVDPNQD